MIASFNFILSNKFVRIQNNCWNCSALVWNHSTCQIISWNNFGSSLPWSLNEQMNYSTNVIHDLGMKKEKNPVRRTTDTAWNWWRCSIEKFCCDVQYWIKIAATYRQTRNNSSDSDSNFNQTELRNDCDQKKKNKFVPKRNFSAFSE